MELPIRTCTGCRRTDEKRNMTRVVRTAGGAAVDREQVMPGRGGYVHRAHACVETAVKRGGLARTLRCQVSPALLAVLKDEGLS